MTPILRLTVLLLLLAACGSDGNESRGGSPASQWRLTENLRLGSLEAGAPDGFGDQLAIAVGVDGAIYVADNQASEIRVFDTNGGHVRTIGRKGAGPAEFQDLIGLEFGPDETLWAVDRGLGRISVFDREGNLTSTQPHSGFVNLPWAGRIDREGVLHNPIVQMGPTGVRQGYQRSLGGEKDTLLIPPYELQLREVATADGESRSFIVPFSARPQWVMDWDGMLWFGTGDDYRIFRIAYNGDTAAVVEGTRRRVPIPDHEADAALAELRDRLGLSAAIDPQWLPGERPAFEDIHVDRRGRVWVSVPVEGGGHSFDVFDFEGRHLAVARFEEDAPHFEQLVVRDKHLYGVVRGELDVPYVVRFRIPE